MPRTINELIKPKLDFKINPIDFYDQYHKPLLLFVILSLISNKHAIKKINFDDIKTPYSPKEDLKIKIKRCINDITILNNIIVDIKPTTIVEELGISNSFFVNYGEKFILIQLLLRSFYNYLGLSCMTIESFDSRKNTYIGFNNYIDFKKDINKGKLPIINSEKYLELLNKDYSSDKLQDYPDILIVNEWENDSEIEQELSDVVEQCNILNERTYNKLKINVFDNQEYELMTCISTNYKIPPQTKYDKSKKHNVIYFRDEMNNIYTYANRVYEFEKLNPGVFYNTKKIENIKCDKIYQLKPDDKYPGYDYSFLNDKCDIVLSDYNNDALNFSLFEGSRTFIYYRKSTYTPVENNDILIDDNSKKYLKEIKFSEKLDEIKKIINSFYNKSTETLALQIITENDNKIHQQNIPECKKRIVNKFGSNYLQNKQLNLEMISDDDKTIIKKKIENDIIKYRKNLEIKLHTFLAVSFQLLITKIQATTEKELFKIYKDKCKKIMRKWKQDDKIITTSLLQAPQPQPIVLSAPVAPAPASPSLVLPNPVLSAPQAGKNKNKKKKK
jgi:hypothetical protein